MSAKVSQVRKLIDEGEYEQAKEVMQKALIQKNFRPQPHTPLPLCVLKTRMLSDNAPKNYVRELNMATGEATVSYSDGSTRIDRSLFVSRNDDTVVYEITKTGSKFIDCELSFDVMDKINCRAPNALSSMPEGINARYERQFMSFAARNDDGTEFGASYSQWRKHGADGYLSENRRSHQRARVRETFCQFRKRKGMGKP